MGLEEVSEHSITQRLDNFNPTDNRTFQIVNLDIIISVDKSGIFFSIS